MGFFGELKPKLFAKLAEVGMSAIGSFVGWVALATYAPDAYFAKHIGWGSSIGGAIGLALFWHAWHAGTIGSGVEHPLRKAKWAWTWLGGTGALSLGLLFVHDAAWLADKSPSSLFRAASSLAVASALVAHVLAYAGAAFAAHLIQLKYRATSEPRTSPEKSTAKKGGQPDGST